MDIPLLTLCKDTPTRIVAHLPGKVSLFLFLGLWWTQVRCQKVLSLFPRGKEQATLQDSTFAPQHQFVEEI